MEKCESSNHMIFPKGEPLPAQLNQYFSGECFLSMLIPYDSPLDCPICNVTFAPSCRNNWHKHPGGQILLITNGHGWYQEWGKPACPLKAGDVVEIPCNVKHWHGAAKDSWFTHLAIEANPKAGSAQWLEPVSEAAYGKL